MSSWGEDLAGLVESKVRRATGTRVSVYDGEAAGTDTHAGRWQSVFEDHGAIISHETKTLARSHAVRPDGWCEGCREEDR